MFDRHVAALFRAMGRQAEVGPVSGPRATVRAIPSLADNATTSDGTRRQAPFVRFDIRKSEYPAPASGHTVDLGGEVFEVAKYVCEDPDRLIWTLECHRR